MKIQIIAFGRLDEKFYQQAAGEYLKRLSRFCDLTIVELKEQTTLNLNKNKRLNSELLLEKLKALKDYQIYFLDVQSPEVSSLEFAELLGKCKNEQTGKLCLVIGPSDGYDFKVLTSGQKISFGKITLPHQLFRVVLLEQLYRGFKIINQEKYHK